MTSLRFTRFHRTRIRKFSTVNAAQQSQVQAFQAAWEKFRPPTLCGLQFHYH